MELVLRPELQPADVVVFDNLSAHLAAGVTATIKKAAAKVFRLPPYSSDYTSIEEMWPSPTARSDMTKRTAPRLSPLWSG